MLYFSHIINNINFYILKTDIVLFPQVEILFYFHKQIISDGREGIIFIRKKVKQPKNEKYPVLFRKQPVSWLSKKLADFCGIHQIATIVIVSIFFALFLSFLIIKNFFAAKVCDDLVYTASFFVDFATLPLVVVTLMFTAHSSYEDSQLLGVINSIKSDVKKVETLVTEKDIIDSNEAEPLDIDKLKKRAKNVEVMKTDVPKD